MNPLSQFINDIPSKFTKEVGVNRSLKPIQIKPIYKINSDESTNEPQQKFSDGERVKHIKFGGGVIVEQRGRLITIAFNNPLYGVKKFIADVAPIKKI